ncbi:MAG: phosphatidylserine/phosphatidylglycerophosphate/cardiolipin synthase family protein [Clostridia bacterium]|nr:phosphatidylserine/phosphatidylglycerophosphate/cardiolipin synthase family protein [Clostridia bacterium]
MKNFSFYLSIILSALLLVGGAALMYFVSKALNAVMLFGIILRALGVALILLMRRYPQLKLMLLGLLFILPWFGFMLVLYFLFGSADKTQKNKKVGLYVDKQTFLNENDYKIDYYDSGKSFFEAYLTDIKNAKKCVEIYFYIFESGYFATRLVAILFDLLNRGVSVTISADWYGSGNLIKDKTIKKLKMLGAKIICYKKPLLFLPKDNIRCHAKVTIIDDKILYLPSCNLCDDEILKDKNIAVKLSGKISRALGEFAPLFAKGKNCDKGCDGLAIMLTMPNGFLRAKVLSLLSGAEKSVIIVTPYLSLDQIMVWEISKLISRGVRVDIIVPNKRDKISLRITKLYSEYLLSLGANIYCARGAFLHAKAVIIDNRICQVGSANFDVRSLREATESIFISSDNRLIAPLLDDFSAYLVPQNKMLPQKKTRFNFVKKGIARLLFPIF